MLMGRFATAFTTNWQNCYQKFVSFVTLPRQIFYHAWQMCHQTWWICYLLICSLADLLLKEMNHVDGIVFMKL